MKTVTWKVFCFARLVALALVCGFASQAQAGPSISSISPGWGPVGTIVTINGSGFGTSQGSSTLQFGTYSSVPTTWSATQIVTSVPNMPIGKVYLAVTVAGASASTPFTVGNPPNLTGMTPGYGPQGTVITFTGQNFGATQGSSTITLGTYAMTPTSWSNTQIVAPVPGSIPNGKYYPAITVGGLQNPTSAGPFTVGNPPIINSVSPASGAPGTSVTITGVRFGSTQGTSVLKFGTYTAAPTSWSDTQVVAPIPSGIPPGNYYPDAIVGGLDTYTSTPFTVTSSAPVISSLSPNSGLAGTTVTVTGSSFGATQGGSTVTFNGTRATPTSWSDTQIVVPVPSGATTGKVYVTVNGIVSDNGVTFTVPVAPIISSVSPTSGGIGTSVTITGSSFGNSQGQSTVSFNGAVATSVNWSDTQIVVPVPAGATTGQILVTTAGGASNGPKFVVLTAPIITGITPTSGTAGTQITISGSGFGTAQGGGRILLGSLSGMVSSWSDTQIVANVSQSSTSGFAQVFQNGIASNKINFSVSAPAITSVTPTSGPAGTQVTITGSGFGASQGNGKVMLGTAYGSVQSWSDTQVVAVVSPGSISGAAQVSQGGVWSNSTNFTVSVPTITSITPTSGGVDTSVTIIGSDFGASQNAGQVWLGATYGTVTSWSDTQIVASVAAGAPSGKVQVLQYGVWSNSVSFSDGTPQITGVNPASGVPGTQVTISGSNFGASQGSGTIWLGSVPGIVSSWADTQIVATVASQSATGIARVSQNGLSSNSVRFVVPTVGSGNNATLTPSVMNMLVGETRSIQALDSQNHLITGLTWATSDSTIVSLSTDDPPVLTALVAGHVTITAGDSSADVTVSSGSALASGAMVWSNSGDGSGVVQAVPAVPSPTGVADVFALQVSGSVQAVLEDGTVAWTANAGQGNTLLPEFQGGLIVSAADSIKRFDGLTGQQVFAHSFANPPNLPGPLHQGKHAVAVHPDGTIFAVDGDSIVGLDGQTGAVKFSVPIEDSSYSSSSQCAPQNNGSGTYFPFVGPTIIAGDGYFYMPYEFLETQTVATYAAGSGTPPVCNSMENDASHLRLIRVGTDGSVQKINFGDWTGYDYSDFDTNTRVYNPVPNGDFESLMTNADKGVLFTWSLTYPVSCSHFGSDQSCFPSTWDIKITDTSTGASTSTGHLLPAPVLQAQDGTFVGNAINTDDWTTINLAGFNSDGSVKWIGPLNYQALYTTSDGGTIAQSDSGVFVTLDQNGIVNGQFASLPTRAWMGDAYRTGSGSLDSLVPENIDVAESFGSVRGPVALIEADFLENGLQSAPSGNASGNATAIKQNPYPRFKRCTSKDPNAICPYDSLLVGLQALQSKVNADCPDCVKYVFNKLGSGGDQKQFSRFISRLPGFFDGTRSTLKIAQLCEQRPTSSTPTDASYGCYDDLGYIGPGPSVADFFAAKPGVVALAKFQPTNAQNRNGKKGLIIFFRPTVICTTSALSDSSCQIGNQSMLFHEALHEYYGFSDSTIQTSFGITVQECTANISDYIAFSVFNRNLHLCTQ